MIRILLIPSKVNSTSKTGNGKPKTLAYDINLKNSFFLRKASKSSKVWIDLENPSEEDLYFLAQNCQFHPLAIEDCVNKNQRPKFEDYDDHAFIVMHNFKQIPETNYLINRETHAFFNDRFLVTVHEHKEKLIDDLWERCKTESILHSKGTDHLLYLLLDILVDSNFPVLDQFSEAITDLENQILTNSVERDFVSNILMLKRKLAKMRRVLSPQREVLNLITRRESGLLTEKIRFYFRDVYDHLSRLVETIDMDRDLIGNTMDAYFSLLSQKNNETIKRLTLVSLVFLPITFLTGFFGMNFTGLPFSSKPILFVTLISLISIPGLMVLWFMKSKLFKT
ncbi:magnesium and cobalt transport protein CorA [Leptospira perolatii]|uniref:Magnesium transport protein CorA n=1 Tax=Leptospira perolatii TaxID=2023191 RepID=A0A2M9ZNN9_9LEPT|nr:magnesium and cobalt transport protein CorA [Leptospira perolatii]PJZ73543.1 magnesium and cobalt transport protein CorA [Leptospira perolatii]